MAAAGGMMVGFLSGYAGCQNSNPKTTTINVSTQSNELAETVKTLAESHQALAESHQALVENYEALVESHQTLSNTVNDLQEQMSQVNAGTVTKVFLLLVTIENCCSVTNCRQLWQL